MLDDLKKMAFNVKKVVEEYLENNFESAGEFVKIGEDGTPTTNIDIIAENEVIEYIKDKDLPVNLLSEEYGFMNRNYERTLILDPIDGSFNAENNIPVFSISLAVAKEGLNDLEYALILNITNGKYYWAEKGKGAYFMENRLPRINSNKLVSAIRLGKESDEKVFEIIKNSNKVRSLGCSSLEMAMVAEGSISFFLYYKKNYGILRITDIAASVLILREAGGQVYDPDTMELLNMKLDVKERKNVVASLDRNIIKRLWGK
ncbi:MAG: inositol monophosphatase family protein [Thermoplasmata archaeon]